MALSEKEHLERRKLFKRFLKEVGLYPVWVKCRRHEIIIGKSSYTPKKTDKDKHFACVDTSTVLSDLINNSFTWSRTYPNLWSDFYYAINKGYLGPVTFDILKKNGVDTYTTKNKLNERMKPYIEEASKINFFNYGEAFFT